ncbi:MAG TPA: N-acetylmuramoyl-L-alanine amidase, partial [Longimicrobiales bacterium]
GACGKDRSPTKPPQCTTTGSASPAVAAVLPRPLQPGPYHALFQAAAAEFGVPAALLESIGWTETRWSMVQGHEEFEGMPPAFGVMALRGEALQRAAALAGVGVQAARTDAAANIRAGAALLAAYGKETGADATSPASWYSAAARYSGIELPEARAQYTSAALAGAGIRPVAPLASVAADTSCGTTPPPSATVDEPGAIWHGSPNFNQRMAPPGGTIHMIIVHTCEGNYAGCWSWLQNTASQVSAHYVMNEEGTEVTQLVREKDRAWQIAATYDCTLNFDHDCAQGQYNGVQSNHFTIGVEHGGYADVTQWTPSFYAASARLMCDISKRWDIPRDWRHIVGHGQLQPNNRTDPGSKWPWTTYMGMIQRACGELVVDDDNARNDTAYVKAQVAAGWTLVASRAATAYPPFYGFGYRSIASDAATDAPLVFSFHLDAAATKAVEGWWVAGSDRTSAARFVAVNAAGDTVGSVTVDQTKNGGAWQALGQWSFSAGWNRIVLSRRSAAAGLVVGDAIRVK